MTALPTRLPRPILMAPRFGPAPGCAGPSTVGVVWSATSLIFGPPIGDDEGIDRSLSSLTPKFQLKAVLQKGLQHKPQLAWIGLGIFCFPFHIEAVRANPTGATGYLELLDLIGKGDQHFECYVPAAALWPLPTPKVTGALVLSGLMEATPNDPRLLVGACPNEAVATTTTAMAEDTDLTILQIEPCRSEPPAGFYRVVQDSIRLVGSRKQSKSSE
jgi:hypothetical protein